MHTRDLAMTPEGDEIYFSVSAGPVVAILGSRLVGGEWTQPEVADFSADPTAGEIEPQISPDGSRFFFMSTRQPYPGEAPDRLTRNWLLNFHSGPESGNPAMYWMDAGVPREYAPGGCVGIVSSVNSRLWQRRDT